MSNSRDNNHILLRSQAALINHNDISGRLAILQAALRREAEDGTPDRLKASLLSRELLGLPVTYQEPSLRTEFLEKDWKSVQQVIKKRREAVVLVMDGSPDIEVWKKLFFLPSWRLRRAAVTALSNALAAAIIIEEIAWIEMRECLSPNLLQVAFSGADGS